MVDVVGIGNMCDDLFRRRIEDANHLLFLGKGKMYESVEGKTFDGEATTQSTEGFVLLKDYGLPPPLSYKHVPLQGQRCLLRVL